MTTHSIFSQNWIFILFLSQIRYDCHRLKQPFVHYRFTSSNKGKDNHTMISKKIILIGDFSTGKTSLIRRFVDNQFSDAYLSTIGVKISQKNIVLGKETVRGLIWDIEGGTQSKPLNRTYVVGAHGCIIIADITREETISNIASYIETLQTISPGVPFILVLNKCDKVDEEKIRMIYQHTLKKYQSFVQDIHLVSAKSGEGVEKMFTVIARRMLNKG